MRLVYTLFNISVPYEFRFHLNVYFERLCFGIVNRFRCFNKNGGFPSFLCDCVHGYRSSHDRSQTKSRWIGEICKSPGETFRE